MFIYYTSTILVFFLLFKINNLSVDGVRILLHSVPIPRSENSPRSQPENIQFQVQNVADGTYHFGYDIDTEDTKSFREERRYVSGRISGKYGYVDPDGILRAFEYEADSRGYRSQSLHTLDPDTFIFDNSNLQLIGPIPKPIPQAYTLTRKDYFGKLSL